MAGRPPPGARAATVLRPPPPGPRRAPVPNVRASTSPVPTPPTPPAAAGPAAVLWDMDGTLVDTEPCWVRAESALVAAHGGTWSEADARAVVGADLLDAAAYVRRVGGVDMDPVEIVRRMVDEVADEVSDSPPWQPGARELLGALAEAGVPCALVTMSWRRLVQVVVGHLPAGTFAAVVAGDEVERGKPHPDPYLLAAARLGVDPARCVAIEDSPAGVASARAAGCVVLGVPHAVGLPPGSTDAQVPSLTAVDVAFLRVLARR